MNFVGLPRSGKTSTLHRLLGDFINIDQSNMKINEPSTGVAERRQLFIQCISKSFGFAQKGQWTKKDIVGETSILNDVIQEAVESKQNLYNTIIKLHAFNNLHVMFIIRSCKFN